MIYYDWKLRNLAVVTSASARVSVNAFTRATIAVEVKPKGGTETDNDAVAVCCDVSPVYGETASTVNFICM
jgi:hypothetical protein